MRTSAPLSLILLLCLAAGSSRGEDNARNQARWPQFRGPGGRGAGSEELRLPTEVGPGRNVLWKTPLPSGHSSPCIWDDRIYLTGFDRATKKLETLCIDRTNGNIRWRQPAPTDKIEHVHEVNSPASSTTDTAGEQVYVYFGSYGLLCYDREGTLRWKLPLEPIPTPFGSGTSPVV